MSGQKTEYDEKIDAFNDDQIDFPKNFNVIIHNDDYTTMEFVIFILQSVFGKSSDDATAIMFQVHNQGKGLCGVYTHEIAETKQKKVSHLAKESGYPLKCTIEEE